MTDLLFVNGRIWTGNDGETTALAVRDGIISALGDEAVDARTDATHVIDLDGGMLLPGFGDGHTHPMWAGEELVGVPATGTTTLEELLARLEKYAADHPHKAWLTGGAYVPTLAPGGEFQASWLDRVVSDRPVVLASADHHTLWVNSEALRLAGITRDTPDPEGGVIVRDEAGDATGLLQENAQNLVLAVIPPKTVDERVEELAAATAALADAGVTWAQCAGATPEEIDAFVLAHERGRLAVRLAIALWVSPSEWREQVDAFTRLRDSVASSDDLSINSVKFMGDGALASADHPTAAMLEPYETDHSWHGVSIWDPEELKQAAAAFDARGFQLHIHGVGDRAVRQALDAIEYTRSVNSENGRRPIVAHVILAQTEDLARFEPLGAIPVMTPIWAQENDWTTDIVVPAIGEHREKLLYPIGTLANSSVPLSFGSDWPVTSHRPLEGLSTAVSRQTAQGTPTGGWLPEQRISLPTALAAYTTGPAHQSGREERAGRLAVGMVADLVQLDRDLFALEPLDYPAVKVVSTWLGGVARSASAPDNS